MAAAINVKLIPVLLILPIAGTYHDWRRAGRFLFGVFPGVIPFIPVLLLEGRKFYYHAIAYGSTAGRWGINYFLLELLGYPPSLRDQHHRKPILREGAIHRHRCGFADDDPCASDATIQWLHACSVHARLFLILAPGFSIQYTLMVLPLLYATGRMFIATIYSLLTGIFLWFAYFPYWKGGFPIDTWSLSGVGSQGVIFGLLAWAMLIVFVYHELRRPLQGKVRER